MYANTRVCANVWLGRVGGTLCEWEGAAGWRVSGSVGDGFVLLEPRPLARGVVHFEDGVHQHGGAARAVGFGQHFGVLAQLDLDDVALLRTRVLCTTPRGEEQASLCVTDKPSALYSSVQSKPLYFLLSFINKKCNCQLEVNPLK